MKRSPGRRWLIVVRIVGVGAVLAGCVETPVPGSDSAAPQCSVEATPEEPGCLVVEDESVQMKMAIVFLRRGLEGQGVEAALLAQGEASCPAADGHQSLTGAYWPNDEQRYLDVCARAGELGADFGIYPTLLSPTRQWTFWTDGHDPWTSLRGDAAGGLGDTSASRVFASECVGVNQDSLEEVPIYEDSELTDGTVTLAELTPDGAVLDFDFDGARGRIASRVCTMNDGLW